MAKMTWDDAEKKAKEAGGGTFVSLKNDKDKIVGSFVGDPDARETAWENGKSVPYVEKHAKENLSPQLKVKFNFAVFKQGNGEDVKTLPKPEMKVLEVNAKTFSAIAKARNKYGLDKCLFEIERNGVKGDTKTTYSVLPDDDLTGAHKKAIEELKPHKLETAEAEEEEDFENYGKDDKKPADGAKEDGKKGEGKPKTDKPKPPTTPPADDGPIAPEDAQALVARLKALNNRESLDKFLSKFGVAKIKDVKKKDIDDAKAFITALEPQPEPAAGAAEEDPFS